MTDWVTTAGPVYSRTSASETSTLPRRYKRRPNSRWMNARRSLKVDAGIVAYPTTGSVFSPNYPNQVNTFMMMLILNRLFKRLNTDARVLYWRILRFSVRKHLVLFDHVKC